MKGWHFVHWINCNRHIFINMKFWTSFSSLFHFVGIIQLSLIYICFEFLPLSVVLVSFFGEKNRTDKDKLPITVRKEKHNTWTHGLLWSISMPAKVPGGCRLQFEQIARDVRCRKPSSKDDIKWSTWFCCYSNCNNSFNSFRKENCCYRSKASPLSF